MTHGFSLLTETDSFGMCATKLNGTVVTYGLEQVRYRQQGPSEAMETE